MGMEMNHSNSNEFYRGYYDALEGGEDEGGSEEYQNGYLAGYDALIDAEEMARG